MNSFESQKAAVKLKVSDLTIDYGQGPILNEVNLEVYEHEIFGIIGPANSGKTSFLKALNRMKPVASDWSKTSSASNVAIDGS